MNTSKKMSSSTFIYAAVWLVTYTISLLVIKKLSPSGGLGIALVCLPVVSFALFLYNYIKQIAHMDEVQIRIQLEAAVIAFSLGLVMIMTLGLLDLTIELNKEDWGYRHLVPYFAIFYFIGLFISTRKYS